MVVSTACPECEAYYERLGRRDGGCRPGCGAPYRNRQEAYPYEEEMPGLWPADMPHGDGPEQQLCLPLEFPALPDGPPRKDGLTAGMVMQNASMNELFGD